MFQIQFANNQMEFHNRSARFVVVHDVCNIF